MFRIYSADKATLQELLTEAGTGRDGARLLIPDLQRPYRWAPNQVVALMDSLLRGWPFGTLLLWDVGEIRQNDTTQLIPSRTFWAHVDRRTSPDQERDYQRATPPARIRMVLDGQQRLQSLLLATAGGNSGFTLFDRDWIADRDPEQSARETDHWVRAQLYLDVPAFVSAFVDADENPLRIEYQAQGGEPGLLAWAYSGSDDSSSAARRASQTIPIARATSGQHVQLGRLWTIASGSVSRGQAFTRKVAEELEVHGFDGPARERAVPALAAFTGWLGELKETEISFLKLQPRSEEWPVDDYDDAVITVFTRLNSGGTALTQQEIVFAWLKRKWEPEHTGQRDAETCFSDLARELAERGVRIGTDDLVRAASAIWSAFENGGSLVGLAQIRRGERIAELAPWLARHWTRIASAFREVAVALREAGLEQGRHYESVNSVFVLVAWHVSTSEWAARQTLSSLEQERLRRAAHQTLSDHVQRWVLVPQWAGAWQRADSFPRYVADIGEHWTACLGETSIDRIVGRSADRMSTWISAARPDALKAIDALRVSSRNVVRRYHSYLWTWQSLEPARAQLSRDLLTFGRGEADTHVDHVVSYKQWSAQYAEVMESEQLDDADDGPNAIGNCMLLHANFNIGKREHPLRWFLDQVHTFHSEPARMRAWCDALGIGDVQLDATGRPIVDLRDAVLARTKRVRSDLAAFVRDDARIQRVAPASARVGETAASWVGTWDTESTDGNGTVDSRAELVLHAVADEVGGTYTGGGVIDARVERGKLRGTWREGGHEGRFKWLMAPSGDRFDGTWGNGSNAQRQGRAWRGVRRSPAG